MSLVENIGDIRPARALHVQVAIWQIHPDPSGLVMDSLAGLSSAQRDRIAMDKFRAGPTLLQDWTEIVISPDGRERNDYVGDLYRTPERAWVLGPRVDATTRRDQPGGYLMVVRYPDGRRYVTYLPVYWDFLKNAGQEGVQIRWCSTQIPAPEELDLIAPEYPFFGAHRFTGMFLAAGNRGAYGYGTEWFGGLLSPRDVSENFRHFTGATWYRPGAPGPVPGFPTSYDQIILGVPFRQHRLEGVAVYAPDYRAAPDAAGVVNVGYGLRGDVALRTLQGLGSEGIRRILGIGDRIDISWATGALRPTLDPSILDLTLRLEPEVTYIPPTVFDPDVGGDVIPEAGSEGADDVVGDGSDGPGMGTGLAVAAGLVGAALILGGQK